MCCLIQYLIPFDCLACEDPNCTHYANSEFNREVNKLICEIKEQWPGSLHVVRKNLDRDERLTLWSMTKYLLITTLRDGQCIPPLEFIAVKKWQMMFRLSAIIISEFSGNSKALGGVIKINPSNTEEITKAMDTVIQMSEPEKSQRLQIAYNYIEKHSTLKWAAAFLKELKRNSDRQSGYSEESNLFFTGVGLMATLNKT